MCLERLRHVDGDKALAFLLTAARHVPPAPALLCIPPLFYGVVGLLPAGDEIDGLVVGDAHVMIQEKPLIPRLVFIAVYGASTELEDLLVLVGGGRDFRDVGAPAAHGEQ